MKRRLLSVLLCVILAILLAVPAIAADTQPRVLDKADLLTAEEEAVLEDASYQFCTENSLDAVILTLNDLGGKSISSFADDWYDQNGYGVGTDSSGLILVVSMAERELYISTCGDAINRLNDRELDGIIEEISYDLSDGSYFAAFITFFDAVERNLDYDSGAVDSGGGAKVNWLLSLLIGAVAAAITVMIMASTMNTKRTQYSAGDYVREGSYDLKNRQDIFLYSNVSKVKREQNNGSSGGTSVHRSSSGRSHGGRGGRF